MSALFTYEGQINGIKFSVAGEKRIRTESCVSVSTHDLFKNNAPYPGGVYDAHMGTTDHAYDCQTCFNQKKYCPGHPGSIPLKYPVWNPISVAETRKWLKLICFECGKPSIERSAYINFPEATRLAEASKLARANGKPCANCKTALHPKIKRNKTEPLLPLAEVYDGTHLVRTDSIYPHIAAEIFSRVPDECVIELGKSIDSHPRNSVLREIQAPPTTMRPDVRKLGGSKITIDVITTSLQLIIKKNEKMPLTIPQVIDSKLGKAICELSNTYHDMLKAKGEDSISSVASRIGGKSKAIRGHLLGKRVVGMCRSTITGMPTLEIDEVGVPLKFARTVQFEENAQEYNMVRLLEYIRNGRDKYPGASKVILKETGAEMVASAVRTLNPGDKVLRDMINGDYVCFNRQPSMLMSNISAHRVRVMTDESIKTLMMNVIATPLYNADFDGDQMNLIINSSISGRHEVWETSCVAQSFISPVDSLTPLGQVDDSIVGLADLTANSVKLTKYNAMRLFQHATVLPSFDEVTGLISGRDCISKLLEPTPITFTRTAEWYNPNYAAHINYDPEDIKVKIVAGKHISGVLDKKSIGKRAAGGIYHLIEREYGAKRALESMFNTQQLAIAYTLHYGRTIGVMDIMVRADAKARIDEIIADKMNESNLITQELITGELVPPMGKTIEEAYEERQINALTSFDDFSSTVLGALDTNTNNLLRIILTGSKGKIDNLYNIVASIGPRVISGKRIAEKFGYKRTLPYSTRFDTSPESRGNISNCYFSGMNMVEYICNAMAARFDIITKALSTSITGEQSRKSIKSLETMIVNNLRWATKDAYIMQFAYGEDFLDPRSLERVKFPTVMIADGAFKSKYYNENYTSFFDQMNSDRVQYRRIFLKVEHMNIRDLMSDERKMPVNIERIISGVTGSTEPSPDALDQMVAMVVAFADGLKYVLANSVQERLKIKLPAHVESAVWLLQMLTRSHLHPNALRDMKLTKNELSVVLDKIRFKYTQALIAPGTSVGIIAAQAFSEPLTQYMLDAHHRSASGGTSKSGITGAKEILGAKTVDKLESPSMMITVEPSIAADYQRTQEMANTIEVMKFIQFLSSCRTFYEKYGEPVHSKYSGEASMIREFNKLNPLMPPPGNLTRWCLRFELDKKALIYKNMALDQIIVRLREAFPECYIINSAENSPQVVIRVYVRASMYKGTIGEKEIEELIESFEKTIIRGVAGIVNAQAREMIRSVVREDGSIGQSSDKVWGIFTTGTNVADILQIKGVDKLKVQTSAIREIESMFGIEAARQALVSGLRGVVSVCDTRHYYTYADEMTFTGRVTSIEVSGLRAREKSNVLLHAGFSSALHALETAANNASVSPVIGITGSLMVGSIPKVGTLYNTFSVNPSFVKANVKSTDALISDLVN